MIGSQLVKGLLDQGYKVVGVDRVGEDYSEDNYEFCNLDLADAEKLNQIVADKNVERIIHLAALAHRKGDEDLSWERYKHINVDCAKNVFNAAGDRPLLFISTVDVYGFYDGKAPVNGNTEPHPVSKYGKSKVLAEAECKKLKHYTIFRFSPVYTDSVTRDIQKRYYLKYPKVAYKVGKGTAFEILNINKAVSSMVQWCSEEPANDIRIIKDDKMMWTPDYIADEKNKGNAKVVFWFPRWLIVFGYVTLKLFLGNNEKIYLINKAVHPLRSEHLNG
jgi:nucleoside-diphosphate-sugar epimerase